MQGIQSFVLAHEHQSLAIFGICPKMTQISQEKYQEKQRV